MLSRDHQIDQSRQAPDSRAPEGAAYVRLEETPSERQPRSDDPSAPAARALQHSLVSKLTAETVRIQEEERRKLSLELHDDIAQIMGNLVLMMDACLAIAPPDAENLQRYLRNARETAKDGFRRVQRFSLDLRPPMLDDLGLAPTIVWYADRFTRENDIPVAVAIPERLPALTGEQQTALFRIVQSALHNVRRHAHARQVSITLEQRLDHLHLAVADDGVGFDPGQVERQVADGIHLGLAGMRYRAELLRGTLHLISAAGPGTTIVAEIPLAAAQARFSAVSASSALNDPGSAVNGDGGPK